MDPLTAGGFRAAAGRAIRRLRRVVRRKGNDASRTAPLPPVESVPQPEHAPGVTLHTSLAAWTAIWFERFRDAIAARATPSPPLPPPPRPHTWPLMVMRSLNLLDPLFLASGPVLLVAMAADALGVVLGVPSLFERWPALDRFVLPAALAASVGYWTNWLALKMLFRPREPGWPLWQGVVPHRRRDLATILSREISHRLLNREVVRTWLHETNLVPDLVLAARTATHEMLRDGKLRAEVSAAIYRRIESYATSEEFRNLVIGEAEKRLQVFTGQGFVEKAAALLQPLWGPRAVARLEHFLEHSDLPELLREHVLPRVEAMVNTAPPLVQAPGRVEEALTDLVIETFEGVDLPGMIAMRLESFDTREMEALLTGPVVHELRFVQVAGGIFGLLAGLALLWMPARIALFALVLTLAVWYGLWRTLRHPSQAQA
ncbi:MAG: DUF445 family protein [Lentisphaeria bacterium]|nr:DUF445 family protein [Lentisphaeria bacterium]